MMKLVGITQRIDEFIDRDETRDSLDQRLNSFVQAAGYIPVPIPNFSFEHTHREGGKENHFSQWLNKFLPDAFILSGGSNIGENANRDMTENQILTYAEKRSLPMLGICRGMLMMAQRAGIALHKIENHVATKHKIHGEINELVNSFHNLAIDSCPDEFSVLAQSLDGEIEAIRHRVLKWEGWMWHPERMVEFSKVDIARTQALFG